MSRQKPRRTRRAPADPNTEDLTALRAELADRLNQLRAVIEAKRLVGWTVVGSAAVEPG